MAVFSGRLRVGTTQYLHTLPLIEGVTLLTFSPVRFRLRQHRDAFAASRISQARNRAVLEAIAIGADAIAFLDDDNLPELGWLEALIAVARKLTWFGLLGGRMNYYRGTGLSE